MITKNDPCETYQVHNDHEWATICLRQWIRESTDGHPRYCGEILINSSFGSWANSWGHCGTPFKSFLAGLDFGYLFGKLMGTGLEVFDGEGSINAVKQRIIECRRGDRYCRVSKEEAREAWDALVCSESEAEYSLDGFVRVLLDIRDERIGDDLQEQLAEPWEYSVTKPHPQAVGFWEHIWPEFKALLEKEALEEKAAQTS